LIGWNRKKLNVRRSHSACNLPTGNLAHIAEGKKRGAESMKSKDLLIGCRLSEREKEKRRDEEKQTLLMRIGTPAYNEY
jgi:hypothetical protein